jgi:hypothetical protein
MMVIGFIRDDGGWRAFHAQDLVSKKNRNLDLAHSSLTHSDAAFTITHPERE